MKYLTTLPRYVALALGLASATAYSQAPQDAVKRAGRSTKDATTKAGNATTKAAKKTAHATEKAGRTAAGEVKKGIDKIK
jgi:hypothetical protein